MAQLMSTASDGAALEKMLTPSVVRSAAYQDASNQFSDKESLQSTNRLKIAFSNFTLGTAGLQFNIPNNDVICEIVVTMALPQLPANCRLPRAWGIRMIKKLSIFVAGASPYDMTHREIFVQAMRECDTRSKRDEYLLMCGREVNDGPNEPAPVARVVLPLPWSTLKHLTEHIGFDTALLSQNIRMEVTLADASELYSGSNSVGGPTSLTTGYIQVKQLVFKESSQMVVRQALRMNPDKFYAYRFLYHQPFPSSTFAGSIDASQPVTVSLNGFRNADLKSITFLLYDTSNNAYNPLQYDKITNLTLEYNGVELFRSEHGDSEPWCMVESLSGKCAVNNEYVPNTQVNSPFVGGPTESMWTSVLFVPRDEVSHSSRIQSGISIPNQTIIVRFNTPNGENSTYQLFCTFNYGAQYLVNQSNAAIMY